MKVLVGDCREVMADMPENSVDCIVTDPPYGLEFMGKEWDAPWQYVISETGYTDGGQRLKRPSFGSSRNPVCRKCRRHQRGGKNRAVCECPSPDFDGHDKELANKRAFQAWSEEWAREAFRVLKPGGHMLAFSGTRTYHRMVCAIEDAGFEIRDRILHIGGGDAGSLSGELAWVYGSG